MSKLLRYYTPGRVYFVTSVAHDRVPLLVEHFSNFWEAVKWSYSSLGKYFEDGYYSVDWGVNERLNFSGEYGE